MTPMKDNFQHVYYRGALDFCNYNCYYCPFGKKTADSLTIKKDQDGLDRFFEYLKEHKNIRTVFLLPYGEGMVHRHYLEFLARVVTLDHIEKIAVQTNGSFSMSSLKESFSKEDISFEKLVLWCSYHPSQVEEEIFLESISRIRSEKIELSVGVVGDPRNKDKIISLRKKLDEDIYLWINKLDGFKRDYSQEEVDCFTSIDPFFPLELEKWTTDIEKCKAGRERIFLDYKLRAYPCNIARTGLKKDLACHSSTCSCFLAYSNRKDIKVLERFKSRGIFRILETNYKGIVYFDMDGTILEKGRLDDDLVERLKKLGKDRIIFLNTSQPFELARKKLGNKLEIFHGGIFSNGGSIKFFRYDYSLDFQLDIEGLDRILAGNRIKYFVDGARKSYKLLMFTRDYKNLRLEDKNFILKNYSVSRDDKLIYINNKFVDKEKSMAMVNRFYGVKLADTVFFGNSENDILKNKDIENIIVEKNIEELLDKRFFKKTRLTKEREFVRLEERDKN